MKIQTPITYHRGPLDGHFEIRDDQPKLMLISLPTPMALTTDGIYPLTAIYERVGIGSRYDYLATALDDTSDEDYDANKS